MEYVIAVNIVIILIGVAGLATLYFQLQIQRNWITTLEEDWKEREKTYQAEKQEVRKDARKRSGAVQWGKTIEHFVPFMTDFPIPPESVTFLGMPIDYVGFTETESSSKCAVHFVEVKSGNAFLLDKQKNIRTAIKEGRVYWHEISVDSNKLKELKK